MTRLSMGFVIASALVTCACSKSEPAGIGPAPSASATSVATASAPAPNKTASAAPSASSLLAPAASSGYGLGLQGVGPGGGCPCGCDRSRDMVDELRHKDKRDALSEVDESIRTIGQREDAGYITERMVEHRLRLLALGSELGAPQRARPHHPSPIHARTLSDGAVRFTADLVVHGETTEIIRGKEKPLRASFVVRIDVENAGASPITVERPTLESDVPLPIKRWYAAGTDGQPWDGVLAAHEKRRVHVIGYAGEPLRPGTRVNATLRFGASSAPLGATAKQRWDES
jgi:hypothetical protein